MNNKTELLRRTLDIALRSHQHGNLPFGCLLADSHNNILAEGENSVISSNDPIAHCEINLIHQVAGKYEPAFLQDCIIYASTEPCPMCTGAIFWSGIGKLVFALDKNSYHQLARTENPAHIFDLSSESLLKHGGRKIVVEGPSLKEEAKEFYRRILAH
jgi:tRNA(Arg) A34 adenosine deaminase TadA